jgi:16S rRNA (cytidine1402-2'-O)-methyltransferase
MARPGTLYLIPSPLGSCASNEVLPPITRSTLARLTCFIVEDPRTARAFLKAAGHPIPLQDIQFGICNEHTKPAEVAALIRPLREGRDCGLMSDAGCPAVADPGAAVVRLARAHGVRVVPLVGPSSIVLALMASGLDGQQFAFHGYLPVDADRRRTVLIELERDARRTSRTQIFIEAPYRNMQLLRAILSVCSGDILLCLATDLTLATEAIATQSVAQWRAGPPPALNRRPTVFLLGYGSA